MAYRSNRIRESRTENSSPGPIDSPTNSDTTGDFGDEGPCSDHDDVPRYRHDRVSRHIYQSHSNHSSFRSSRTWMAREPREHQEFLVVRNAMRRLFKKSDVAQWKFPDYVAHRSAMVAAEKERLSREVEFRQEEKEKKVPLVTQPFYSNPRILEGNLAAVLHVPTIWCVDWQNGKDEIAPWPSYAEMKWEGDDRAKTDVWRFPPIPREMGAPGIAWNQLQAVEQYDLDKTWLVPTMEDIFLPVDEIDNDVKYDLITKELEDAINASIEC
ncbi:hypothetical protein CC78DRAFT_569190 [Lojkania enalia]|uniref:Uncharacterized protein n=1 Tax=Lojkania enalia TaxID=147567 RepID=A0A9P4MZ07_9PLEO|nr:hypothetical protein CC78DRAFT_569190 [Didymosphaeria enalia]